MHQAVALKHAILAVRLQHVALKSLRVLPDATQLQAADQLAALRSTLAELHPAIAVVA
ncbi:MAG: hypothetical protein NTY15_02880 [Planctomycetota bacterium]|nr:hypothetical protein [Planctomycetota bacterium]